MISGQKRNLPSLLDFMDRPIHIEKPKNQNTNIQIIGFLVEQYFISLICTFSLENEIHGCLCLCSYLKVKVKVLW